MKYFILFYTLVSVPLMTFGMEMPADTSQNPVSMINALQEAEEVCGICREPGTLRTLPCHPTHKFHDDSDNPCLREWKKINPTCPTCRSDIPLTRQEWLDHNKGLFVGIGLPIVFWLVCYVGNEYLLKDLEGFKG